jgi:hypothetical protein
MSAKIEQSPISQQDFLRLLQQCCDEGKETKEVKVETFIQGISEKLQVLYHQKGKYINESSKQQSLSARQD